MPDLVAQGPEPEQRWRRALPADTVVLGRVQKCDWEAPWDEHISRRHASLTWKNGKLHVVHLPDGKNPVFFNGTETREFDLAVGEHFVIGKTKFFIEDSGDVPTPTEEKPEELTCSMQELKNVRYRDAEDRIEALAKLPVMLRYTPSDQDFETQVIQILLEGIPRAEAAAVVWLDTTPGAGNPAVHVSTQAARHGLPADVAPSKRLVQEAIRRRRQPVLYSWNTGQSGDFTQSPEFDWALCAPLPDEPKPGYALYVTGRSSSEDTKMEDLKFSGLVAEIVGQLRQVRDLQKRRRLMEGFLSPRVVAHLAGLPLDTQDMDQIIRPYPTNVTVLFCDLRGSCKIAEGEQDLLSICDQVTEALQIMTRNISAEDGVIGDFQGDAAMGFWGWPEETPNQVERAAKAALGILREFNQARRIRGHPLAGFACGVGIAHGPGIAGRLGTLDQFKIGAFGPPVNLAARLESLTKYFGSNILIDENAAGKLASLSQRQLRLRRLARIQPYGMKHSFVVHELMPPAFESGAMAERDHNDYEAALDNFLSGRWDHAASLFERLPFDKPSQVLREYIKKHKTPPKPWDGVMVMESK